MGVEVPPRQSVTMSNQLLISDINQIYFPQFLFSPNHFPQCISVYILIPSCFHISFLSALGMDWIVRSPADIRSVLTQPFRSPHSLSLSPLFLQKGGNSRAGQHRSRMGQQRQCSGRVAASPKQSGGRTAGSLSLFSFPFLICQATQGVVAPAI